MRVWGWDLACGKVNDVFGELICVARAFPFADCHANIMP